MIGAMKCTKSIFSFAVGFFTFPLLLILAVIAFLIYSSSPMKVTPLPADQRVAVDSEQLKAHVLALTGTPKPRHSENIESLEQAANYIEKYLTGLGLKVVSQRYEGPNGKKYRNLSVLILPAEQGAPRVSLGEETQDFAKHLKTWPQEQILVLGAHYDVCWEQVGADDNASGVAGILELAKALVREKPKLKYPVNLVAFTLEEPNYYDTEWMGSYVYAKALKDNSVKLRAMLSIEMIGYFSDVKGSQRFPIDLISTVYPDTGNFLAIVGRNDQKTLIKDVKRQYMRASDLPVESISAPTFLEGIDYSDHRSFWQMGYEAVMVTDTSFFRNLNYHKQTDTPDTLDYRRMADVVRGTYQTVIALD